MDAKEVHILVVDDEPGMRAMLSYVLTSKGFQVMTACDGVDALSKLGQNSCHIVISDIKMPNMDGLTLLQEIKKKNKNIQVVLVTGYGTSEDQQTAMKDGAFDFLRKPFHIDQIEAILGRVLTTL